MPMQANEIKDLILETFPDAKVKIDDLRGDGDHYAAYIETSSFKGFSKERNASRNFIAAIIASPVATLSR